MGSKGLLLFFSVLPVVLILAFVYKKDKDKEPLMLLLSFFFKGIFSCFLVLTISEILGAFLPFMNKEVNMMTFNEVFLYAFFGVALVEEFCKWLIQDRDNEEIDLLETTKLYYQKKIEDLVD